MDFGLKADIPQIVQYIVNAQARLFYGKKTTLPKIAVRSTRGPIFLKFVRVDYDKTQGKLKLSEGEFPGRSFSTRIKYSASTPSAYTGGYAGRGKKIPRGTPTWKSP